MRLLHPGTVRAALAGLSATALVAVSAMSAHAQLNPVVFDGNIVFDNGASGSDHYNGAAAAGSSCQPGLDSTTVQIATVQYTNNSAVNPLIPLAAGARPNWQPAPGSPAYGGNPGHGRAVNTPQDGFFEKVCYVGAIGPVEDWTQGWTYFGLDGSGRGAGGFPVRPLVIMDNQNLYSDRTLSADSSYIVRGQLRVKEQAKLTIPAGTILYEETNSIGTMIIERGGKIDAQGTATNPIVITSDRGPGSQVPGGIGGLFVHGRARTNAVNSCAGDSAASEGGVVGYYGGNDDADSSGVIRYVRIEFAGNQVAPNNEANGLTLNGVGSRTVVEYVQSTRSSDDLLEFFGGTAQVKHAVLTYGQDDGFDWQMGYRGKAQFVVISQIGDPGTDRGIEADNNEFNNATELCSGRSNPTLSNFTILGNKTGPVTTDGVHLRRGTGGTVLNSIIAGWKSNALELNGAETFANHCSDRVSASGPGIHCSSQTTNAPLARGNLFVAFGRPNPVRTNHAITFALPEAGPVTVEVFSADGRMVQQVANGPFAAGRHTLEWNVERSLPAGMYFYQVRAGERQASGKFIRIE